MDWFTELAGYVGDNAWAVWTGLAVLLVVAEMMSLDFFLLMLAVGAGSGALTSLIPGVGVPVQILVAIATSVAMLFLVRPNIVKRMHNGPELTLGHDALVGKQGVAVDEITAETGQVRINGELWSARAYDETMRIPAGSRVDIFQIKGATALVHAIPELDPPI